MTKTETPTPIASELESFLCQRQPFSTDKAAIVSKVAEIERQRNQARRARDAFKELALKLTADDSHKIGVTYSFGGRTHARAQVVNLIESTKPNPGEAT